MFKYIKRQLPILITFAIVAIIANYLDVLFSLLLLDLIDMTIAGQINNFYNNVVTIILYLILGNSFYIMSDIVKSFFIKNVGVHFKSSYLTNVFRKNLNEFDEVNNASYISTLTNDYDVIEDKYLNSIINIIISTANIIGGVIIFISINYITLFVCIGLMLINVIISKVSSRPVNKHNVERSNMFSRYTAYIKEVLSAFHIIKTNDLHDKIRNDYVDKSKEVQKKGFIIDKIRSYIFAIQNVNFQITYIGLFLIIGYMTIIGTVSIGGVIAISLTAEKLVWPIVNFSEAIPDILSVKSIIKRMDSSLENKYNYEETIDFNSFNKDITFNDVSFSYDETQVLENINLTFEKGKKYLVVGPSGGGKSTILRLLRKYFNPQEGKILVDGINLKDIKKEQYFNNIANIEQNVFLFEDSIKNNLTLYKDYPDNQIYDALHRAGLDDFIKSLPQGIDTIIYDNGKNISGGERSRIAIARGLLNNSQIIFLDEAFASLDYERASEIERSILDLDNVTVINVSHVIIKENKNDYDKVFVVNKKKALELVSEE